ncbi:MAG TPA: 50S ribosomal protein L21 [Firmicutes bacterium]|jgi:large subunit ribosomal protein L21|nr:50S ribosomal protein L21 [Bacillota bacterium]HBK68029.1 50S ribosomal protein L21 [Bacillota bacterium]HBT16149.1 50S ribosomal protein L21 [Bacillota bacterium]
MYAIVETGGKQYRVSTGDQFNVEKLPGEVGTQVILDRVLLIGGEELKVGNPLVEGAKVKAEIIEQDKARKILVFRYKAKKNIRKRLGHRQPYTRLRVLAIEG